jgi:exonuclease III
VKKLNISILAQNCQSLNISTKSTKTSQKILAITKTNSDIVFLSDVRLNTRAQIHGLEDLKKKLKFTNYNLIHNSPNSSRGTAILIKKTVQLQIISEHRDNRGNILGLKVNLDGEMDLALVSVYGPNDNDPSFYANLRNILNELDCVNMVVGGDWNSTWDSSPPNSNIDIINMVNLPSRFRTEKVLEIANIFGLTDPYRLLHPNRAEFTYTPNAIANNNRSRIDHFLVNRDLLPVIKSCEIEHGRLTKLFDHKSINLKLGKNKTPVDRNKISDGILDNPIVGIVVDVSVKEAYLNHCNRDTTPPYIVRPIKLEIGRVFSKLKTASELEMQNLLSEEIDNEMVVRINSLRKEAADISEMLPDQEFFESLILNCNPDLFFEGLIHSIKNEILSEQSKIYKIRKAKKVHLLKELERLKKNFFANRDQIFETERRLDSLIENDLKEELNKFEKFKLLNDEKITPYFMNLAKSDSLSKKNLNDICNDDGTDFGSDTERNNFIGNFYKELYSNPDPDAHLPDDCIQQFLGEVAEHPAVTESKLSDQERDRLDRDLKIEELDIAVSQIKKNTAPGIDGISNKFIKKFWKLFRRPLYNYAIFCNDIGALTDSFRTAKIRLIPKKGDTKRIGNWRPISLLNCFYKLISRVFTNRIKPFMNKLTNVGQHGYSSSKYTQEVLISLIDSIGICKSGGVEAAVVSLDIKKAFDSLSHKFMFQVLKFFNFGPKIIQWIKLLCTNRRACIILENGTLGNVFDLERGNAQGDIISPFLFNICYQIVLFKLELGLQIKSVTDLPELPGEPPPGISPPVRHVAKKVFAFADDCNVLTALEYNSLNEIKKNLKDFGYISGLECNVAKSCVLKVAPDRAPVPDPVPIPGPDRDPPFEPGQGPQPAPHISDLGFLFSENITVLGVTLDNTGNICTNTGTKIEKKIENVIRVWQRYNLSLPGRVSIAKTMIYSQLNYTGCFLPIPDPIVQRIESAISNFVGNNLRIAKDRIFLSVELGGLGLFPVNKFLEAQRCSWVKRALNADQLWKIRLLFGNNVGTGIFGISENDYDINITPCCHCIAEAHTNFVKKFTESKNNFLKALVLNNKALTTGIRGQNFIKIENLSQDLQGNIETINILKKLNFNVLYNNSNFVNKRQVKIHFNNNLPEELWQLLDRIRRTAVTRLLDPDPGTGTGISLQTFFATWKKGSKKLRNYLTLDKREYVPHNIIKFSSNFEIIIDFNKSRYLNKGWINSFLRNSIRTFIFKFHNNTLTYNTVLSHFVENISRNCTFCDLNLNPEVEDETPIHLFYNCMTTERILTSFYSILTGNANFVPTRNDLFIGFQLQIESENVILNTITYMVLYFVWECKLRKCLPSLIRLMKFICRETDTLSCSSNAFNAIFTTCRYKTNLVEYRRHNNF